MGLVCFALICEYLIWVFVAFGNVFLFDGAFFGLMVLFSTSSNIHAVVTVILLHFATKHCVIIGS